MLVPTTLEGLQIIPVEVSLGLFINLDIHKYTIEYSNSTLKSTLNERWVRIEFVIHLIYLLLEVYEGSVLDPGLGLCRFQTGGCLNTESPRKSTPKMLVCMLCHGVIALAY